jgi:hypothetical protein
MLPPPAVHEVSEAMLYVLDLLELDGAGISAPCRSATARSGWRGSGASASC